MWIIPLKSRVLIESILKSTERLQLMSVCFELGWRRLHKWVKHLQDWAGYISTQTSFVGGCGGATHSISFSNIVFNIWQRFVRLCSLIKINDRDVSSTLDYMHLFYESGLWLSTLWPICLLQFHGVNSSVCSVNNIVHLLFYYTNIRPVNCFFLECSSYVIF